MIVDISASSHPAVVDFVNIRDRDINLRDNMFIVEGRIPLELAIASSRFPLCKVLIAAARLPALAPALARLPEDVPVLVAPQEVLDGIAGFHLHRGVLALARRVPGPPVAELVREARLVMLLAGLSNHDNVGACFRNAAAFGCDAVLMDGACADPLYRKAIRVSSGQVLRLPFHHGGAAADLVGALETAGFDCWSLTPRGGEALHRTLPGARTCLLLGAEGPGLPANLMARTRRVSIAMAEGVDSLNVATAGAVALAHVRSRLDDGAA